VSNESFSQGNGLYAKPNIESPNLFEHGLKIPDVAKRSFRRIINDNENIIYTDLGKNLFYRKTGLNHAETQRLIQRSWEKILNLTTKDYTYDPVIYNIYTDMDKISPRSPFYHEEWLKKLSTYGVNKDKDLTDLIPAIHKSLDKILGKWVTDSASWDFLVELENKEWVTKIKTGVNAGWPNFEAQSKTEILNYVDVIKRIWKGWKGSNKIPEEYDPIFGPAARTESNRKARVIFMARKLAKIMAAIMSVLNRKFPKIETSVVRRETIGSNEAAFTLLKKMSEENPNAILVAKDFVGYDSSIPLMMFTIIKDWLIAKGTDACLILALECAVVERGYLLLNMKWAYRASSLLSGMGATQDLGTLIHKVMDEVTGFVYLVVFIQSDDICGVTLQTREEIDRLFKLQEELFGVSIAETGVKTFVGNTGIFLQTWITRNKITGQTDVFGQEARKWRNLFYRERDLNITVETAILQGKTKVDNEVRRRAQAFSFLRTLGSFGIDAPTLPYVLSVVYGRNSGFTWTQVQAGFDMIKNQDAVLLTLGRDENETVIDARWIEVVLTELHKKHRWGSVTPAQALEAIGAARAVVKAAVS
jgi:hypothetical protein